MHSDLEAMVAADEEVRARVVRAEARRDRELADARAVRDAAIDARRRETVAALERELDAIRAEGDARIGELQRRQEQYLETLAQAGDRAFDDAVAVYLRIVCEAAS